VVVGGKEPVVLTGYPYTSRRAHGRSVWFYGYKRKKKEVSAMFVVIVNYPPMKQGKDEEFREWFAWSNKEFATHRGFISRRLLKPIKGGNYAAIVEHESHETFMAMHDSPGHDAAGKRVAPLLDGNPTPQFYEVITE
jgi:heme-degrading monooxygenase HmoA